MRRIDSMTRAAAFGLALIGLLAAATPSYAFRMIQNTSTGRVTAGARVTCNNSGGFTHWTTANINWYHNTANQGSGKATALRNAMASWTNVSGANHVLTYRGTTSAGWTTDNRSTVLWATGNGCTGGCLALTALVLQSGQRIVETDITFNNSQTWTTNGANFDTQAVAAHEFGHALGIHHTEVSSSPFPTMRIPYFGSGGRSLEADDRAALQCSQSRYPVGSQLPNNNATFVSSTIPSSMAAGQSVTVSVTMKNSGTTTWHRNGSLGYKLGARFDAGLFAATRHWLNVGETVAPGQSRTFTFNMTAPTTPGSYTVGWQMVEELVEWFGAFAIKIVNVVATTNNAQYITQSVPSSLLAGQTATVSVTMKNNGTRTWTRAAGHKLGSENPRDNTIWNLNRVWLPSNVSVAPGQQRTFTFTIKAPASPGTYNFRWRMVQDGVQWFGAFSPNRQIVVN